MPLPATPCPATPTTLWFRSAAGATHAVLLVGLLMLGRGAAAQPDPTASVATPKAVLGTVAPDGFGTKASALGRVGVGRLEGTPETVTLSFEHAAALDSTALRIDDGSLADLFVFDAAQGDTVVVAMTSEAFTPYLALGYGASTVAHGRVQRVRPIAEAVAVDGTAALRVALPADGTYTLLANAAAPGEQGTYRLEAQSVTAAEAPAPRPLRLSDLPGSPFRDKTLAPRFLESGATVTGRLTQKDPTFSDQTPFHTWLFEGNAGDRIQATLRSDDFDPYLILAEGTPSAPDKLVENNDAPGTTDGTAGITFTLTESGTYTLYANTATPATGAYALTYEVVGRGAVPASTPTSDFATRYPGGGDPDGRYAVLVGINDYPPGVSDLATPVYDARLVRDLLVERMGYRSEDVVLLTDREATREHVLQALGRHLGQAGPDGSVVFYYSGHGSQTYDNEATQDPEADERDETLSLWSDNGGVVDLLDDEIRVLLDALPARRKLLIFDSCHSGTAARGFFATKRLDRDIAGVADAYTDVSSYLTPETLPAYGLTPRVATGDRTASGGVLDADGLAGPYVLLSGSQEDQSSYTYTGWDPEAGRGTRVSVFTYYLLDALEAYADAPDQTLTFETMMNGVRDTTESFMAKHRYAQTPHLSGPLGSLRLAEFFGR
ncbi:MAG: caspase family protein [Bacteroidota bacterium]